MADPALGILMLDTRFERPPGDVGHTATWPFPVLFEQISGARLGRVVADGGPDPDLLEPFHEGARRLIGRGAAALTTSCGFLAPFQGAVAARVAVPVALSSLIMLPTVEATLPPGKRAGVVTFDGGALGPAHFSACGARTDTPFEGVTRQGELSRVIRGDAGAFDTSQVEHEVVEAAERLVARRPDIGAIVFECANLAPYARAVADRLRLPVYDIVALGTWLLGAARPRVWA